ncbi:unnamed protein product [Orchesella dallaii]
MGGCTCGFIINENTKVTFNKGEYGKLTLRAVTIDETPITPSTPGSSSQGPRSKDTTPVNSPFKQPPSSPKNGSPMALDSSSPTKPNKLQASNFSPMKSPARAQPQPSTSASTCQVTPVKIDSLPASSSFESPTKKLKGEPTTEESQPQSPKSNNNPSSHTEQRKLNEVCSYCSRKYIFDNSRPPRIYYATRTHSQIQQVVKQLKNTSYNKVKMTILASREVTCIQEKMEDALKPEVSSQNPTANSSQSQPNQHQEEPIVKKTINDVCGTMIKNFYRGERIKKQVDEGKVSEAWIKSNTDENGRLKLPEPTCKYFQPLPILKDAFSPFQSKGAWDLEDLKTEGKSCGKCPYFGSKAIHSNADIIFCSYNYLIYPSLRESSQIRHVNSIIVFDEAHNIEDICRNAFSFNIEVRILDESIRLQIDNLLRNIHAAGKDKKVSAQRVNLLVSLSKMLQHWSTWVKDRGLKLKSPPNMKEIDVHESFESDKLKDALIELKMTGDIVEHCVKMVESINSTTEGEEEDHYVDGFGKTRLVKLSTSVVDFFKGLHQSLEYLFEEEKEGIGGIQDFKGYLTRAPKPKPQNQAELLLQPRRSRGRGDAVTEKKPEDDFIFTFQILCLNPAIGFRVLKNCAFSIIVASGTLTPLNSFSCELATNFAVTLQADHVIPQKNVWTGVAAVGPRNELLTLVKKSQEEIEIQNEIGDIIVQVCNIVPNGVLVFLPSYPLMMKLKERWSQYPRFGNTILDQIGRKKMIFFEQSKNKELFKRDMQVYAERVKGGHNHDGCILFAVFRGKISEGIDFADEQARAVITVGIPFSNLGSVEVQSKKEYNNKRRAKKKPGENILSGSEWYTIQAFRAMNQGFGRCVRHANDWGALILLDSRMGLRRNACYISGWVNKSLIVYNQFDILKDKLHKFITERQRDSRRQPITIDYEPEEDEEYNVLENTEIVPYPDASAMTQMISSVRNGNGHHHHHVPINSDDVATQNILNMSTSSLQDDVVNVPESSPEYSFADETEFILASTPMSISQRSQSESQSTVVVTSMNENSNSSIGSSQNSVFNRTVEDGGNDSDNSDLEMSRVADMMQSTASANELNQSDMMDVSMLSEHELSQVSNVSSISYNSD